MTCELLVFRYFCNAIFMSRCRIQNVWPLISRASVIVLTLLKCGSVLLCERIAVCIDFYIIIYILSYIHNCIDEYIYINKFYKCSSCCELVMCLLVFELHPIVFYSCYYNIKQYLITSAIITKHYIYSCPNALLFIVLIIHFFGGVGCCIYSS